MHIHKAAYVTRTRVNDWGNSLIYQQKICIKCNKELISVKAILSSIARFFKNFWIELDIDPSVLVIAIMGMLTVALVIAVLISSTIDIKELRQTCLDISRYGHILTEIKKGECFINLNNNWISLSEYKIFVKVLSMVK